MTGIILIFMFLALSFTGIMVIIFLSRRHVEQENPEDENDLEEWTCPECGFLVQAGDVCIYCYTEKPGIGSTKRNSASDLLSG